MSDLETLDGAEQFECHASNLARVVHSVLLRQTGNHHVRVANSLHLPSHGIFVNLPPHPPSVSVAEWLQYLLGQRKDRDSNPGSATCLE